MSAEEELMNFLQGNPYYFDLTRDASMLKVVVSLKEGGKSASDLAQRFNLDENRLFVKLEDMVEHGLLDKQSIGNQMLFFLSFDGKNFIELYERARV